MTAPKPNNEFAVKKKLNYLSFFVEAKVFLVKL
jgi:hypothetical protein